MHRDRKYKTILTVLAVWARSSQSDPLVGTSESCSRNPQSLWWATPCQKSRPGKTTWTSLYLYSTDAEAVCRANSSSSSRRRVCHRDSCSTSLILFLSLSLSFSLSHSLSLCGCGLVSPALVRCTERSAYGSTVGGHFLSLMNIRQWRRGRWGGGGEGIKQLLLISVSEPRLHAVTQMENKTIVMEAWTDALSGMSGET